MIILDGGSAVFAAPQDAKFAGMDKRKSRVRALVRYLVDHRSINSVPLREEKNKRKEEAHNGVSRRRVAKSNG